MLFKVAIGKVNHNFFKAVKLASYGPVHDVRREEQSDVASFNQRPAISRPIPYQSREETTPHTQKYGYMRVVI